MTDARYSIIIPLFNERDEIESRVRELRSLSASCEVIFVDGGSDDGTFERLRMLVGDSPSPEVGIQLLSRLSASLLTIVDPEEAEKSFEPGFKLLQVSKGRGNQMNAGALASRGNRLLFLHADSTLPSSALDLMDEVFEARDVGCFGVTFPLSNIFMLTNRIASNARARRGIMFGDQGIFVTRELFFALGMFPDLPFMEDYQFSLTLKGRGIKTGMATRPILTSNRRYPKSALKTLRLMRRMFKLRSAYRNGVSADELLKLYPDVR